MEGGDLVVGGRRDVLGGGGVRGRRRMAAGGEGGLGRRGVGGGGMCLRGGGGEEDGSWGEGGRVVCPPGLPQRCWTVSSVPWTCAVISRPSILQLSLYGL